MADTWKTKISRLARLVAKAAKEPTPGLAKAAIEDLAPSLRELLDDLAAAESAAMSAARPKAGPPV